MAAPATPTPDRTTADNRTGNVKPATPYRGPALVAVLLSTGTCLLLVVAFLQYSQKDTLHRYTLHYANLNLIFYGFASSESDLWISGLRCGESAAAQEKSCRLSMRTDEWGRVDLNGLGTAELPALGFRIPKDGRGNPEHWEYETRPFDEDLHFSFQVRHEKVTGFRYRILHPEKCRDPMTGGKFDVVFTTDGDEPKVFRLPMRIADLQKLFGPPTTFSMRDKAYD